MWSAVFFSFFFSEHCRICDYNTDFTARDKAGGKEEEKKNNTHLIYLLHFSHERCLDGSVKKTCGDLPCVKGLVLSPYATCVCMCDRRRGSRRERERKEIGRAGAVFTQSPGPR